MPTGPEAWFGQTRPKSLLEKTIVEHKRYEENRLNRTWSAHNFFETGTVHANKQGIWGDAPSFPPKEQCRVSSLVSTPNIVTPIPVGADNGEFGDYQTCSTGRPSTAGGVSVASVATTNCSAVSDYSTSRKERLRAMLEEEATHNASKINNETTSTKELRKAQLKLLREKTEKYKKRKEQERQAKAQQLMYEQFQKNCPELRDIESSRLQKHVKNVWKDQLEDKNILEIEEMKQKEIEKENMERAERKRKEDEKKEKLKSIEAKRIIAEALATQLEELKYKNAQFKKLEQEKEAIIVQEDNIKKLEEQRKAIIQRRINQKYAKMLWRQWKAQLRQRTIERQRELVVEKQLLENLAVETARDNTARTGRKEALRLEILENIKTNKENLEKEKKLEEDLDLMIREKGEQVWAEREAAWAKQRLASEKLLNSVLQEQANQVQEKIERNKLLQAENLLEKEKLIEEIEKTKIETAREILRKKEAKENEKLIREIEIKEKVLEKMNEKQEQELEEAELAQQHQAYKGMVEDERANLQGEPFVERIYARPSTAGSTVRFNIPEPGEGGDSPQKSRPTTANSIRSRVTGPFIY